MLYQKLLMGEKPYFLSVGNAEAYEVHRHSEIELSFCLEGSYDILCENQRYTLEAGDFAYIFPMASHELPEGNSPHCRCVTVELGYTLLGKYLKDFTACEKPCLCCRKSRLQDDPLYRQITETLRETLELHTSNEPFSELLIRGNLYRISGLLLQLFHSTQTIIIQHKRAEDIQKIDRALDIIYTRYFEPLKVETVSAMCGYSSSNFCKIFKTITGDTFHNTLNRHRLEIACLLLKGTDDPVEKIAQEIGFADSKSFCRVFKKNKGMSAGEFRRMHEA